MMTCGEFRSLLPRTGPEDPMLLDHLRFCESCLDHAVHIDADLMFRAVGGGEMIPPGGVDAFVDDVMHAVELRAKEGELAPRRISRWTRRLAVAALLASGVTGGALMYQAGRTARPEVGAAVLAARTVHSAEKKATNPVVDTYSSSGATIVEVPSDATDQTKIVMVIDDSLPADL